MPSDWETVAGGDDWETVAPIPITAPPEAPFPTPAQTAGTMAWSGVKSLPAMAAGMIQGAVDPFTRIPRDIGAALGYGSSPTMDQLRQSLSSAGAALAPGAAGPGERLGHAVDAVPVVGPMVTGVARGAARIAGPLVTTATRGVGKVTPEQMNAAADTGGAAIAGLAAGPIAARVPAAAAKVAAGASAARAAITPANVGKVVMGAAAVGADVAMTGGAVTGGALLTKVAFRVLWKHYGAAGMTRGLDKLAELAKGKDLPGVGAEIQKAAAKDPTLAKTLAEELTSARNEKAFAGADAAFARDRARIAAEKAAAPAWQAPAAGGAPTPVAAAAPPTAAPSASGPRIVRLDEFGRAVEPGAAPLPAPAEAQAAAPRVKREGAWQVTVDAQGRAVGPPQRIEPRSSTLFPGERTAAQRAASGDTLKTPQLPVKGNVVMPSVHYGVPGKNTPSGKPQTPKERALMNQQLEAAEAAGVDMFDAFGTLDKHGAGKVPSATSAKNAGVARQERIPGDAYAEPSDSTGRWHIVDPSTGKRLKLGDYATEEKALDALDRARSMAPEHPLLDKVRTSLNEHPITAVMGRVFGDVAKTAGLDAEGPLAVRFGGVTVGGDVGGRWLNGIVEINPLEALLRGHGNGPKTASALLDTIIHEAAHSKNQATGRTGHDAAFLAEEARIGALLQGQRPALLAELGSVLDVQGLGRLQTALKEAEAIWRENGDGGRRAGAPWQEAPLKRGN